MCACIWRPEVNSNISLQEPSTLTFVVVVVVDGGGDVVVIAVFKIASSHIMTCS